MLANQCKVPHVIDINFSKFTGRKRTVYSKRFTLYYSNTVASQRVILSGNIALNLGPCRKNERTASQTINKSKPKKSLKCPSCEKTVQRNHKRFLCSTCFDLFHAKCTGISIHQLKANISHEWTCNTCILFELPFHGCVDVTNSNSKIMIAPTKNQTYILMF